MNRSKFIMETVVRRRRIEVFYLSIVHLLTRREVVEYKYKSYYTGADLLDYICHYLKLEIKYVWGLRFVDAEGENHWLDLTESIKSQTINVPQLHFYFRLKIYLPEPYTLTDKEARNNIFMQLRFDLLSGKYDKRTCNTALLMGFILQYLYGNYNPNTYTEERLKEKIILNQTAEIEKEAIEIHKNNMEGLSKSEAMDLFLRMASHLDNYGAQAYPVENDRKEKLILCINYKGVALHCGDKQFKFIEWLSVEDVVQKDKKITLHLVSGEKLTYYCATIATCSFITQDALGYIDFYEKYEPNPTLEQCDEETRKDADTFDKAEEESIELEIVDEEPTKKGLGYFHRFFNFCFGTAAAKYFFISLAVCVLIRILFDPELNILE